MKATVLNVIEVIIYILSTPFESPIMFFSVLKFGKSRPFLSCTKTEFVNVVIALDNRIN